MSRGIYIELEGPDGCGKSTQARLLADRLTADGHRTVLSQQPTSDTPIGSLIRRVLRGEETMRDRRTMPLLFAADRMEYSCAINEWLASGAIVVGDRGALSTWAYATAAARAAEDPCAEGVSAWSDALSDFAVQPSLILVLTLPGAEIARRLGTRGKKRELFEGDVLRQHIVDCYEDAGASRLGRVVQYVDGAGDVDTVHAEITARVRAHIEKKARD